MKQIKIEKAHWERAKLDNQNLIRQSTMQIAMAKRILEMIEEKLAEFPEVKPKPKKA